MGPSNVNRFLDSVKNFCITTSIHGLFYMCHSLGMASRIAWLLLFLLCAIACLYQCKLNVEQYLQFRVKTSVTLEKTNDLEFPSITFCSHYQFKRSQFGNFTQAPISLAYHLAINKNEIDQLYIKNLLTCNSTYKSEFVKNTDKYGIDYFNNGSAKPSDYYTLITGLLTNFQSDVSKCWIDNIEVECNKVLLNMPSDDGFCFIFNMGKELAKLSANPFGDHGDRVMNYIGNGIRLSDKAKSSVTFLMDVNQSDYCGTAAIKRGAGYFAMLNERDTTQFIMYNTPINLLPGYMNEVIVKPTFYQRTTENLGLCRSESNVFFVANAKHYMQSLCYFQCIVATILQKCGCYPVNEIGFHDVFLKHHDKLNVSVETIRICVGNQQICARNVQQVDFVQHSIGDRCPECVPQCSDKRFGYRLNQNAMSLKQLKSDLPLYVTSKLTNEELKKNFLYASFSFENKFAEIVQESQLITLKDLFVNLGNNIGLFLGMSFMSNFEYGINLILRGLVFVYQRIFLFCKNGFRGLRQQSLFEPTSRSKKKCRRQITVHTSTTAVFATEC